MCMILVLAACGNKEETNNGKEQDPNQENQQGTNDDDQNETRESLIDEKNPLDERAAIEEVMEKQKQKLKLGFMTDEYQLMHAELDYNANKDELRYLQSFKLNDEIPWLTYESTMDADEAEYKDIINGFEDGKQLEHETLNAIYGWHEDGTKPAYQVFGYADGTLYNVEGTTVLERANEFDEHMLQLMGKSLKTEADGAYDLFYKDFNIDVDLIKYPKLNDDVATVQRVFMTRTRSDDTSLLSIDYYLEPKEEFTYNIRSQPMDWDGFNYEEIGTEEFAGLTINEYRQDLNGKTSYSWTDGTYYYDIGLFDNFSDLEKEDVYTLIESSLADDRSFENKDLFENTTDNPVYDDEAKEMQGILTDMTK